jgi:hypothetical protein
MLNLISWTISCDLLRNLRPALGMFLFGAGVRAVDPCALHSTAVWPEGSLLFLDPLARLLSCCVHIGAAARGAGLLAGRMGLKQRRYSCGHGLRSQRHIACTNSAARTCSLNLEVGLLRLPP